MLFIDEANFIRKEALPAILGFMLQKDAKLIFISSINSSESATSFLLKLKNASERMLNIVTYVCPNHKEDFALQDGLVSCPCYRLTIPSYISIDETIKHTTNLFMDGAFETELVGGTNATLSAQYRAISETGLVQFELCRADTSNLQTNLDDCLYLYIDPAYSNNIDASGTGMGAVILSKRDDRVYLLGIEHYFLRDLTGAAPVQIAMCAVQLIKTIYTLHSWIRDVRIGVEGNSSQDSAVAIATFIEEASPVPVTFTQYTDRGGMARPIYILGQEKSRAFERFIYAMNSGKFMASQIITSNTIKINFDPVAYLIDQIKGLKTRPLQDGTVSFSAKQRHLSDDTLVAVVMANYLATENIPFRSLI